jgi:hypothetical protein
MFIRSKSHEEEEELFVFNFTTAGGSIQPGFNKRVVRSAVAVYRTLVSTREISSLSPIDSTDTESSKSRACNFCIVTSRPSRARARSRSCESWKSTRGKSSRVCATLAGHLSGSQHSKYYPYAARPWLECPGSRDGGGQALAERLLRMKTILTSLGLWGNEVFGR